MTIAARKVPFLDLAAQYRSIESELWTAMREVVERRAFILGPAVEAFERDFAAYCEALDHVAVGSGTEALHLALLALGIGPGDEVITQANTFVATLEAIAYTGARIVLVDVAPPDYALDVAAVEAAITSRTKAIIPVHLYGQPAPLDELDALARRHALAIVEDAAQAHGARYRGRRIGSTNLACFSFYPGKNLGAYGEGGGVSTNDPALAKKMRMLRDHGASKRYVHDVVGFNYRMDGLQGAVLGVKLKYLEGWNAGRRRAAARYEALLGDWPRPSVPAHVEHVHHIYPVFVRDRDGVIAALRNAGIETNVHYPIACHLQAAFKDLGYREGAFPHCERMAREELSLPMYPELEDEAISYVVETLRGLGEHPQ
jgi:dTDP-4-amino-4,6-dideoxygalactose transaminase